MPENITILIIDDHEVVRAGLKAFIHSYPGFEVIGEGCNGREAVELEATLKPDVILLDVVMPEVNGIEAEQQILARNPSARILMITSFADDAQVLGALRGGALGYLLKDSSPQELEKAILQVSRGESYLPVRFARVLIQEINHPKESAGQTPKLTERETEILGMIAQGMSNEQIAEILFLSTWTVRSHLGRVFKKLGVENRTQAALYAVKAGLYKSDKTED
jgi:two-component system, NarL family, response regulator LiaR